MKASELQVGQRFDIGDGRGLRRVQVCFFLHSLEDWSNAVGLGPPSRDHVFAVDTGNNLHAIHPDNSVEAIA